MFLIPMISIYACSPRRFRIRSGCYSPSLARIVVVVNVCRGEPYVFEKMIYKNQATYVRNHVYVSLETILRHVCEARKLKKSYESHYPTKRMTPDITI